MKRLISSFAALVAVACLVSACGQKGPLYLPEDGDNGKAHKSHQHQPKAKPAPAPVQQPELQSEPEQSPAQ
ncbi:LPS translocon maturation chaperone LptM [Pseudomonas putida]|uniref:LPS translocon maturation chaperone LptM n=1 Tax=Pseudomonas putida TaxID=303 RepID=UPI00067CDFC9|nr:lipoprotein [Pseudomonas putida]